MRLIIYSFLILFLVTCNNRRTSDGQVNDQFINHFKRFDHVYNLNGVARNDATEVIIPGSYLRLATNDKNFIVYDQFAKAGKFFYVYDKKDYKPISSFGSPGPGPREGNVAGKFYYRVEKREIVQYIADKTMVLRYNLDSALSLSDSYLPAVEFVNLRGFFQSAPGDNYYSILLKDLSAQGPDSNVFKITNRQTGLESIHGSRFLPPSAFEDMLSDLEFHYGSLAVNQDQTRAVISYLKWDMLGYFDLFPPYRTFYIDGPDDFDPKKNSAGQIARDFNAKWGYGDVSTVGNYIFCTYMGKPKREAGKPGVEAFPNEVHVFDWEGRPIARLILDRYTQCITVDWERKLLISIDPTAQNGIVEYNLSDIEF